MKINQTTIVTGVLTPYGRDLLETYIHQKEPWSLYDEESGEQVFSFNTKTGLFSCECYYLFSIFGDSLNCGVFNNDEFWIRRQRFSWKKIVRRHICLGEKNAPFVGEK